MINVIRLEEHGHGFRCAMEDCLQSFEEFVLTGNNEAGVKAKSALAVAHNELELVIQTNEKAQLGEVNLLGQVVPLTQEEQADLIRKMFSVSGSSSDCECECECDCGDCECNNCRCGEH